MATLIHNGRQLMQPRLPIKACGGGSNRHMRGTFSALVFGTQRAWASVRVTHGCRSRPPGIQRIGAHWKRRGGKKRWAFYGLLYHLMGANSCHSVCQLSHPGVVGTGTCKAPFLRELWCSTGANSHQTGSQSGTYGWQELLPARRPLCIDFGA